MGWSKRTKSNSQRATSDNGGVNWQTVLTVMGSIIFGVPISIVAVKAASYIEESHALILLGAVVTCMLFGLFMICFNAFLRSYAQMRNSDDAEDRKREMDFLKTYLAVLQGKSRGGTTISLPQNAGVPGQGGWYDLGQGPPSASTPQIEYNDPLELQ